MALVSSKVLLIWAADSTPRVFLSALVILGSVRRFISMGGACYFYRLFKVFDRAAGTFSLSIAAWPGLSGSSLISLRIGLFDSLLL